ncbi:anomalous homeobox protein isoform 2-T2 [Liasis olivaceus]
MGRRSTTKPAGMKQFMALLQKSDHQDVPPSKLRDEAGRLCQRLQHSPAGLEKLVKAMAQGRHWPHLCTSLQVVQAFVSVHLQKNQHDMACKLLEGCAAIEKEQLVKLWHEIHYHKTMEKQKTTSLTPVQKYRCRKRNPPPASLCPDGVKNRNYPLDVRERLRRFAVEVTTNPSRKQRETLAADANLPPRLVYSWFANYRRRQGPRPSQQPAPPEEPEKQQRAGRAAGGLSGDAGAAERKGPFLTLPSAAQGGVKQPGSTTGASLPGNSSTRGGQLGERNLNLDPLEAAQATKTETEPALAPPVLEVEWEPAGPVSGPWGQDLAHPYRSACPAQQMPEQPTVSRAMHKGVQCSLWSLDACCQCSCSRTKSSLPTWPDGARVPRACGEAGPKTVRERANWQIEALVLRRRQLLGSWPVPNLPCSSSPNGLVSIEPCPEESQGVACAQDALLPQETGSRAGVGEQAGSPPPGSTSPPFPADVKFQVLWDSTSDPVAIDTWAALLLCELSSGSPV